MDSTINSEWYRFLQLLIETTSTLLQQQPHKARRVCFLRNMDTKFTGLCLMVSSKHYANFDKLLQELTQKLSTRITLLRPIDALYRVNGKRLNTLQDFLDGDVVISCCMHEQYSNVGYSINVQHMRLINKLLQRQLKKLSKRSPKQSTKHLSKQARSISNPARKLLDLRVCHMPAAITAYMKVGKRLFAYKSTAIFKARGRFKGPSRCNGRYIVKVINVKKKPLVEASLNEIDCLRQLQCHDNIIDLIFSIEQTRYLYVVLEQMDADLYIMLNRLGLFTEQQAAGVVRQVATGLQYLQSRQFLHRDIKLENIFTRADNNNPLAVIKIGDFGLMVRYEGQLLTKFCGTISYVAPEVFLGKGYDYAVDAWALGVTFFQLLCYDFPFGQHDKRPQEVGIEVVTKNYRIPKQVELRLSSKAKQLIKGLLRKSSRNRWNMSKVLQSEFLQAAATDNGAD